MGVTGIFALLCPVICKNIYFVYYFLKAWKCIAMFESYLDGKHQWINNVLHLQHHWHYLWPPTIYHQINWLNSQKATFTMIFSSLSAIIGNCFVTIAEEDGNQRHSLILCREIWDCAISDQPPSYQGMAERQLEVSWFLNTTCTNVHPLLTGAMGALGYHTVRYLGKRTTALPGLWTFHQTDFPTQFDRL